MSKKLRSHSRAKRVGSLGRANGSREDIALTYDGIDLENMNRE